MGMIWESVSSTFISPSGSFGCGSIEVAAVALTALLVLFGRMR
jgi:hypothetical protein